MNNRNQLLNVENMRVDFATDLGKVSAVSGVNLTLDKGETLVILGESGSGKSVMAQAIMGIVPQPPGHVEVDRNIFDGQDLTKLSRNEYQKLRGLEMALVFQDALTSLNPRYTIGSMITELLVHHLKLSKSDAYQQAETLLAKVGIPSPKERLASYPHQLSGGMRQRALIAMSIALQPKLLIADEPTTALDVTVQAQVLDLIENLQHEANMGLILITHDLAVARRIADRVAVMYAGQIVEQAKKSDLFSNPSHPYTQGLMRSTPSAAAVGKSLTPIVGSPPDLRNLPSGCPFRPRCPEATAICAGEKPPVVNIRDQHFSLCHKVEATK